MGSDITQYRAEIGLFNHFRVRPVKYKTSGCHNPNSTEPIYNIFCRKTFIIVSVLISISVAIYRSEFKYFNPAIKLPGHDAQASTVGPIICNRVSDRGIYYSTTPHIINIVADLLYSMVSNFQSRYLYGNRKNQGIKICHWNKGGSYLQNKMPELRNIVSGLHPHIFGVSEANLFQHHDQALVQLEDYDLHLPQTLSNPNLKTSRVVTYTHKSIITKPRHDLMSNTISSIWLEVGMPRHKKFLVCQTYREWQLLNQGTDHSSQAIPQQLSRWLEFLDQWEIALSSQLD